MYLKRAYCRLKAQEWSSAINVLPGGWFLPRILGAHRPWLMWVHPRLQAKSVQCALDKQGRPLKPARDIASPTVGSIGWEVEAYFWSLNFPFGTYLTLNKILSDPRVALYLSSHVFTQIKCVSVTCTPPGSGRAPPVHLQTQFPTEFSIPYREAPACFLPRPRVVP